MANSFVIRALPLVGKDYLVDTKVMETVLGPYQSYVIGKAAAEYEKKRKGKGYNYQNIPPPLHIPAIGPKPPPAEFVYAFQCGDFIKLGRTYNGNTPERRMGDLQTASPYVITLLHKAEVPDSLKAERILHETYAEHRTSGEWFKLPTEKIQELTIAFAEIAQM